MDRNHGSAFEGWWVMERLTCMALVAVLFCGATRGPVPFEGKVQALVSVSHGPGDELYGDFVEPTGPALPDGAPDALMIWVDGIQLNLEGSTMNIPGMDNASPRDVFWWKWRWNREKYASVWVKLDFDDGKVKTATFDVRNADPMVFAPRSEGTKSREPSKSRGER